MIKAVWVVLFLQVVFIRPVSAEDAWERVEKTGELRWGADDTGGAPYIFRDPSDPSKLIGFEVEVMDALAAKLGLRAKVVLAAWDQLVPALLRDDFDVAFNGLEITSDRQSVIRFSVPYYIFSEQLTVRKSDVGKWRSLEDLYGHAVGTLSASLAYNMLVAHPRIKTVAYPSPVESYKDLEFQRTDAVLMDVPIAQWYAGRNPKLANITPLIGESSYGAGIRNDSPMLQQKIDQGLRALLESGELERIYRKWNLWDSNQSKLTQAMAIESNLPQTGGRWQRYIPLLFKGAGVTILLSIMSMALAIGGGLILCLAKLYGPRWGRSLASAYVEVVRGTPLLIQLYLLYYGLPNIGIELNAFVAALLGMGMNYAAYEAEVYRSALLSIPKGQTEAARSLGLSRAQSLRLVLLPQALRTALPPSTNDFIALFKDTSIVSIITVTELTKAYTSSASASYRFMELGLLTAALYFLMSYPLSVWSRRLERRQHAVFH